MAIHGPRAAARWIAAPSARNDGGGGNTGPGGQFVLFVIAYRDSSPVARASIDKKQPMRAYSRSLYGVAIP